MDKLGRSLRILQVNTVDIAGGAEKVALGLFQIYRAAGCCSQFAVGDKRSNYPGVLEIPNDSWRSQWARLWKPGDRLVRTFQDKKWGIWLLRLLAGLAEPRRQASRFWGIEDFNFPGTHHLLELLTQQPDILHCHNLHGGYFDLRILSSLSQRLPVVLTLHDAWLLSGHCAHSFDCERWKIGCGHCPDLTIYPATYRDATSYNWQRKKEIFAKSRLYVATPSRWLMQKVEQSILAPAIIEARVIPNGVDLSIFHPADRQAVRAVLDIPEDTKVLLFTSHGIQRNIWKDYSTIRIAIAQVAERLAGQRVLFIGLGEDAPAERIGQAEVQFVPFQRDPSAVACYYQAADVYIHAARADTFPTTVLEALACGTPVVATAVGGIPEQVNDGLTGFLVPPGDGGAMAVRIVQLLVDDNLRRLFSQRAADSANRQFNIERQANDYLTWYSIILKRWHDHCLAANSAN